MGQISGINCAANGLFTIIAGSCDKAETKFVIVCIKPRIVGFCQIAGRITFKRNCNAMFFSNQPQAWISAGPNASGKSFLTAALRANNVFPPDSVFIDCDELVLESTEHQNVLRKVIPEKRIDASNRLEPLSRNLAGDEIEAIRASFLVHRDWLLSATLGAASACMRDGKSFVFGSTMATAKNFSLAEEIKRHHYKLIIFACYAPVGELFRRNARRIGGSSNNDSQIKRVDSLRNLSKLLPEADASLLFWNPDCATAPRLAAYKGPSETLAKLSVHFSDGFTGTENHGAETKAVGPALADVLADIEPDVPEAAAFFQNFYRPKLALGIKS